MCMKQPCYHFLQFCGIDLVLQFVFLLVGSKGLFCYLQSQTATSVILKKIWGFFCCSDKKKLKEIGIFLNYKFEKNNR
jgi:hypothetical protein